MIIPQYLGLTAAQCEVIYALRVASKGQPHPPRMVDVAKVLGRTRQCVSAHLLRLLRRGVVRREKHRRSYTLVERNLLPVPDGWEFPHPDGTQRDNAAGKRVTILSFLGDGHPRTTQQVAALLGTSGPGALYLLRGLEADGRVRADRSGRHWCWTVGT